MNIPAASLTSLLELPVLTENRLSKKEKVFPVFSLKKVIIKIELSFLLYSHS